MVTKVVKVHPVHPDGAAIQDAAAVVSRGGLLIIPTETVYGIAASSAHPAALERLYEIKQRPKDKPFSLLIDSRERIEGAAGDIPVAAYKLMNVFWPGALTLILRVSGGGTVAFRLPDHAVAKAVLSLCGGAAACPSANISGAAPPVNCAQALRELDGLVDFALDAGPSRLAQESTIVDASGPHVRLVRQGAIPQERIDAVVKKKIVLFVCTGNSCRSVMAQGLLQKKLQERARTDIEVISAGTMMLGGMAATPATVELLRKEGIDMSRHLSLGVTRDMLEAADIILVMERYHERRILEIEPKVSNRLFLLKEFAKSSGSTLDISDPIGKSFEFYEETFATIKESIERIIDLL